MMRRVSLSLLACVGLIAVAACSKPEAPPPEAPQTTAGMTGGQGSAGDTFGILRSIHEGEVELSTLAQQKATDPRVRAYADNVAKDHKARMAKDNQLMSGLASRQRIATPAVRSRPLRTARNRTSIRCRVSPSIAPISTIRSATTGWCSTRSTRICCRMSKIRRSASRCRTDARGQTITSAKRRTSATRSRLRTEQVTR